MSAAARFAAVAAVGTRQPKTTVTDTRPLSEIFGARTFGLDEIGARLPSDARKRLLANMKAGQVIDKSIAGVVAHALKEWALQNGVTHFCHWFQPLTGTTAEKHDSFVNYEGDGVFGPAEILEKFSARELVQGEPDASSFPSGGLRTTFEARGYTIWDPTTPPFITESANGKTLCIPSTFISYTGETLDHKAPLLRSVSALNEAALRLLATLGEKEATRVAATVGPEQEYFLVDRALFQLRTDLLLTGRTVFGAAPPKGQELEDQYFGAIRERVLATMMETERELAALGIPVKTRHNEVAPAQSEIAVMYEAASRAADHNQLVMETFRRVAARHDLVFLVHEKPFAGINGSGKHVNWSMATDSGDNLLEPGDTPHKNVRFLAFAAAVIRAVYRHSGLLRATVASAANDHRLGANEAPPAIMSVFLGDQLTKVLEDLEAGRTSEVLPPKTLDLGVIHLPTIAKDNTDRNRTSPFAFTGNKFEFRAVGSSSNISFSVTVLNTAVAESIDEVNKRIQAELSAMPGPVDAAALRVIRNLLPEVKAVIFNGNGYSKEWHDEAARRGLPNDANTPDSLHHFTSDQTLGLFEAYRVLSAGESRSRLHIALERYVKQVLIEARVGLDMFTTGVLPAVTTRLTDLAHTAEHLSAIGVDNADIVEQVRELAELLKAARGHAKALAAAVDKAHHAGDEHQAAVFTRDHVLTALAALRGPVDALETLLPDALWPFPKYRELLFLY